jgi:hypothetical protein
MPQNTIKDCMNRIDNLEGLLRQVVDKLTEPQPVKQVKQPVTVTNVAATMPQMDESMDVFIQELLSYKRDRKLKKHNGVRMAMACPWLTAKMQERYADWTQSDTYGVAIEAVEQGQVVIGTGWSMRPADMVDATRTTHRDKLSHKQFIAHYQGR